MQILSSLKDLKTLHKVREVGLTIGNFDGVHLGHQNLLRGIKKECDKNNWPLVVMTFVPHPIFVLKPQTEYLLNTYEERRSLLEKQKVDFIIEVEFSRDFSTLTPEKFLNDYIVESECVRKVFLGHDFAFGANKAGDHEFVKNFCKEKMIDFSIQEKFDPSEVDTSSSTIRSHIQAGSLPEANELLGRDFFIKGGVIKGVGRGKTIGFPTANIHFSHHRLVPERGVYISKTALRDKVFYSVTNIGFNPTFNDGQKLHVETHILDFDDDIYGEEIEVFFLEKLRNEIKFENVEALVTQIEKDVNSVKEYFNYNC